MKKVVELVDRRKVLDEASAWVLRLDSEEALSVEEKAALCKWLGKSESHKKHFDRLARVWIGAEVLAELAIPVSAEPAGKQYSPWYKPSYKKISAMAASVLITIGVGLALFFSTDASVQQNRLVATAVGEQESINLADGSILMLNTNSSVRIDYTPEFRNIQLLSGEAHFEVEKDKDRPFRVYAGAGRIHAIGTSFSVYLRDDLVDITVSEGRVGVAALAEQTDQNDDIAALSIPDRPVRTLGILRAGEAGLLLSSLDDDSNRISTLDRIEQITDIDVAKRMAWTSGVLMFAGEPLEDVIKEIGRYTDVSIEFSNPELKQIRIGGNFPVGETETMFSSLETNFGLRVSRPDSDRVVISGSSTF